MSSLFHLVLRFCHKLRQTFSRSSHQARLRRSDIRASVEQRLSSFTSKGATMALHSFCVALYRETFNAVVTLCNRCVHFEHSAYRVLYPPSYRLSNIVVARSRPTTEHQRQSQSSTRPVFSRQALCTICTPTTHGNVSINFNMMLSSRKS